MGKGCVIFVRYVKSRNLVLQNQNRHQFRFTHCTHLQDTPFGIFNPDQVIFKLQVISKLGQQVDAETWAALVMFSGGHVSGSILALAIFGSRSRRKKNESGPPWNMSFSHGLFTSSGDPAWNSSVHIAAASYGIRWGQVDERWLFQEAHCQVELFRNSLGRDMAVAWPNYVLDVQASIVFFIAFPHSYFLPHKIGWQSWSQVHDFKFHIFQGAIRWEGHIWPWKFTINGNIPQISASYLALLKVKVTKGSHENVFD